MIALSTAFNISKARSWKKLLAEIKKLGFSAVELNVEVPEAWMPEIERSVQKGEIVVTSLHNHCPSVADLPLNRSIYSGYLLTADEPAERALAVKYTVRTVEWAARLGAKAVVVHAGEIPTEPSGREFYRYLQQFGHKGRLYPQYLDALRADRKKKSAVYLQFLKESLDKILIAADSKKIMVGLENRFHIHEIPDLEELSRLLAWYPDAPVGYWHDTGHAEVFVRQGWVEKHADFLTAFPDRIVGMHLHDLRGLSDHHAPGSGDFDFTLLLPYLTERVVKVIEAHAKSSPDEVRASLEFFKKHGIY
jgi:sugar phosphate isomerase/epimerase